MSKYIHGRILEGQKQNRKLNICDQYDPEGKFGVLKQYSRWTRAVGGSLASAVEATDEYFRFCRSVELEHGINQQRRYSTSVMEEFLLRRIEKMPEVDKKGASAR